METPKCLESEDHMVEIQIISDDIGSDDLLDALGSQPGWQDAGVHFELRKASHTRFALETAVAVAIVSAVSSAATTLIAGLLKVGAERARRSIKLRGTRDGKEVELEVPVGVSKEEIDNAIAAWAALNTPSIYV
jgi:hypothetical protein